MLTDAWYGLTSYPCEPARAPTVERMRPQLGSAPKIAAFTSDEPQMARAKSLAISSLGAPVDHGGDALGRPFAVGGDGDGELLADLVWSAPGEPYRTPDRPPRWSAFPARPFAQREDAVVGAHVRRRRWSRLKVISPALESALAEQALRDGAVGGDDDDHRGHLRRDHPRALADGGEGDRLAADGDQRGLAIFLRVSVVMIASAARSGSVSSEGDELRHRVDDLLQRAASPR